MTVAEFIEGYCSNEVDFYHAMRQLQHVWATEVSNIKALSAIEEKLNLNKQQVLSAVNILLDQIEY